MISVIFFLVVIAIIGFLIYSPAIYCHVMTSISEKRFKKELKAIEDERLFEKCRIVITRPLGVGIEPDGEISFAVAMRNQELAMKSIIDLINEC